MLQRLHVCAALLFNGVCLQSHHSAVLFAIEPPPFQLPPQPTSPLRIPFLLPCHLHRQGPSLSPTALPTPTSRRRKRLGPSEWPRERCRTHVPLRKRLCGIVPNGVSDCFTWKTPAVLFSLKVPPFFFKSPRRPNVATATLISSFLATVKF